MLAFSFIVAVFALALTSDAGRACRCFVHSLKGLLMTAKLKPYDYVAAIMAYEDGSLSAEDTIVLFQYLVDSGLAWSLQGAYGRVAVAMIKAGTIEPYMPERLSILNSINPPQKGKD